MAKQIGDKKLTGTIDNVTFYKMEGEYYVRMKSSLTRKRFFKDAAFEGSRSSSKRLAAGSKLASAVYRTIPQKKREYSMFCELKSLAIKLMKEGQSDEEVMVRLNKLVREKMRKSKMENRKSKVKKPFVGVFDVFVEPGSLIENRRSKVKVEENTKLSREKSILIKGLNSSNYGRG